MYSHHKLGRSKIRTTSPVIQKNTYSKDLTDTTVLVEVSSIPPKLLRSVFTGKQYHVTRNKQENETFTMIIHFIELYYILQYGNTNYRTDIINEIRNYFVNGCKSTQGQKAGTKKRTNKRIKTRRERMRMRRTTKRYKGGFKWLRQLIVGGLCLLNMAILGSNGQTSNYVPSESAWHDQQGQWGEMLKDGYGDLLVESAGNSGGWCKLNSNYYAHIVNEDQHRTLSTYSVGVNNGLLDRNYNVDNTALYSYVMNADMHSVMFILEPKANGRTQSDITEFMDLIHTTLISFRRSMGVPADHVMLFEFSRPGHSLWGAAYEDFITLSDKDRLFANLNGYSGYGTSESYNTIWRVRPLKPHETRYPQKVINKYIELSGFYNRITEFTAEAFGPTISRQDTILPPNTIDKEMFDVVNGIPNGSEIRFVISGNYQVPDNNKILDTVFGAQNGYVNSPRNQYLLNLAQREKAKAKLFSDTDHEFRVMKHNPNTAIGFLSMKTTHPMSPHNKQSPNIYHKSNRPEDEYLKHEENAVEFKKTLTHKLFPMEDVQNREFYEEHKKNPLHSAATLEKGTSYALFNEDRTVLGEYLGEKEGDFIFSNYDVPVQNQKQKMFIKIEPTQGKG